jgi:hypothetical protein
VGLRFKSPNQSCFEKIIEQRNKTSAHGEHRVSSQPPMFNNTQPNFTQDINGVSKYSLNQNVVTQLIKLGHSEEKILYEVEDEESTIGKLY